MLRRSGKTYAVSKSLGIHSTDNNVFLHATPVG